MASKLPDTTVEHTKYGRMCRMVVELSRDMLWELLVSKIPINELPQKVKQNLQKLQLNPSQILCICKHGGDLPTNSDVDISILYTLLRNICPKLKPPTNGWFDVNKGNCPGKKDIKIGDDIERIRMNRNILYGHATEARLSEQTYNQGLADMRGIASRMDSRMNTGFTKYLTVLEKCCMDPEVEEEYMKLLLEQKLQEKELLERIGNVEETNKEIKESQCILVDKVKDVEKKSSKHEGAIHNLQDTCTETAENVKTLQSEHKSQSQDVGQLSEQVNHLARSHKEKGTSINIVQNFQTTTNSEERFRAEISTKRESTNESKTNSPEKVTTQTSNASYASVLSKNLPTNSTPSINVNVHNVINVGSNDHDTEENQEGKFLSETSNFNEGHFILVTAEVGRTKCLESLALVPWTTVFDFDPNSRTTGLLSVIEHKLSEITHRSLHINCLEDYNVNRVTENSTHWMFCRGCRENSNSRYTDEDWQQNAQLKAGVKSFIKQLKDFSSVYTNYKVVIIWPTDDSSIRSMYLLVDKLQKHVKGEFIVINRNENISEKSRSYQNVLSECERRFSRVSLKLEKVCGAVSICQAGKFELHHSSYQLPTADNTNMVNMTEKEASWLEEAFVILYLNKRHESGKLTAKQLRKECEEFYKGGTLPWYMWYEVDAGHVDAKRDCMEDLIRILRKEYIDLYQSGMITLHHAPGSGGTTLAQRILWELRKITPCVQLKLRSNATLNDIVQRLQFLHEKTGRPLLLLIDGEEDHSIRTLLSHLGKICVVVFNLQRYPYRMKNVANSSTCFWLKNTLSINEANMVALKFQAQCSDQEKKNTIEEMADDVRNGGQKSIFEFGLAAYTYKFKGIEAYVNGYISLSNKDGNRLLPWQTALGMLSLAYYYGHVGLPCQFFVEMLNQRDERSISVTDFPENMQNLIVKDITEDRKNIVRIGHYYVAKEILEQILPWPQARLDTRHEMLSIANRKTLETFVLSFIKEVEKRDEGNHGKFMIQILTRTFIIREEKFQYKDKNQQEWKTEKVSKIFLDLGTTAPQSEMFTVMQQLTRSFPKDPHLHAHLGRMYTIFRPEKVKEAEDCFKTALKLCDKMSHHQNVEEMPHHVRSTYTITHSMCANMFKRRTGRYTGFDFNQRKPKLQTQDGQFEEVASKLLDMVKKGKYHFQKWRDYDPDVSNMQYSYLGEIQISLMFCDFLYKKSGHPDITQFCEENDSSLSIFAEECIYQIDELFLEFFSTVEPDDEFSEQVINFQQWYNALFKTNSSVPGKVNLKPKNAHNQRLQIALLKLHSVSHNIYGVLENIECKSDIERIIASFEEIFRDVHENGTAVTRSSLDQDYREWLVAIRNDLCQNPYSIEAVLNQVQKWYTKFHTPLSKFYLFVLKSILGFGNTDSLGNTQLLIEAQSLKTEIAKQTKFIVKCRHPREWLGMGPEIRQLTLSTRFYSQEKGCKKVKPGSIDPEKLALMKGTIGHPNENPNSGFIRLDLGTENNVSVQVNFTPLNFEMHFKSFANERVEFNLGFSYTYGYEAYNVKRLKKLDCKECKISMEATSRDLNVKCVCGCINPVERE